MEKGLRGTCSLKPVPRAVFLGHQEREILSRAYASSDIFLFPSETETFGNVTLEAMASGVPTVCADATGSSSLVLHDQTGYLVPGRDVEAFKERVMTLVTTGRFDRRWGRRPAPKLKRIAGD